MGPAPPANAGGPRVKCSQVGQISGIGSGGRGRRVLPTWKPHPPNQQGVFFYYNILIVLITSLKERQIK